MWSPDRRSFLALPAALLAGCGYRPAFAPGGLYGAVEADDPTDGMGFDFMARIERRLGAPEAPRYRLAYRIATQQHGVTGMSASSTTRFQITGRADWAVSDLATGAELTRGSDSTFTSFSAVGSTVAERTAERDAYRRLAEQLADQVATEMAATWGVWGR